MKAYYIEVGFSISNGQVLADDKLFDIRQGSTPGSNRLSNVWYRSEWRL